MSCGVSCGVLDAVCHADVTYFPFDTQACYLNMTGWYYELHELAFELYDNGMVTFNRGSKTENSMWDVYDITLKKKLFSVYITIKLNRKPLFYVYNIIYCQLILYAY